MVGLYESVIDALCVRVDGDRSVRPKIVASTATARQARDQIQALFARSVTQIFPPPGPGSPRLLLRAHRAGGFAWRADAISVLRLRGATPRC